MSFVSSSFSRFLFLLLFSSCSWWCDQLSMVLMRPFAAEPCRRSSPDCARPFRPQCRSMQTKQNRDQTERPDDEAFRPCFTLPASSPVMIILLMIWSLFLCLALKHSLTSLAYLPGSVLSHALSLSLCVSVFLSCLCVSPFFCCPAVPFQLRLQFALAELAERFEQPPHIVSRTPLTRNLS